MLTAVSNTAAGHRQALGWVRHLEAGRVAVEGSGGYGRPLALVLVAAGVEVVEVPPQMTARARNGQRSRHKSDPSDALLIARVGAREDDLPRPRPAGVIEDLRSLVLYRLYAAKGGLWPRIRLVGGVYHVTPQWSKSLSR